MAHARQANRVRLPHRRHYTPATEYSHGPPHTLRAVPSMVDLDLAVTQVADEDGEGVASGRAGRTTNEGTIKRRGTPTEKSVVFEAHEGGAFEDDKVKHYDADGACVCFWRASTRWLGIRADAPLLCLSQC
jgi:dihydrosphingosine 1-phosphate phosphatase